MEINWIIQHFYPETGGAETHAVQISRQLVERGHEVIVHTSAVTSHREKLPLTGEFEGIKIQRYRPQINRGYFLSLFAPLLKKGDILVMEGYPSLTNDYVMRKYRVQFPTVIYPLGVVQAVSGFAAVLRRLYDKVLGIKTLKAANRIVALTEVERGWYSSKGIDVNKIDIIPAGISNEAFERYDAQIIGQKYGFERYILFIGRMFHEKAPTDLVRALSKVRNDFKDLGVIFVGPDQGEIVNVKALAKKLGLEDNIICVGKASSMEKYEFLAGCEFLVLPSKFEAQGIVFIEAWAQKKAVIGTKVGGVPYIVKDGETGLLYDHGDINALARHIRFLLENPDKTKMMGKRGFEIASKEYRWKNIVDRIEKLYSDAIRERGKKV